MKGSFEESAERENKVRGNLFMQHFSFSFSFLACNLPTVNKQQRTFHLVCFRSVIVPSLQVSHLSWQTQMFASVSPLETWKTAHSDGSWVKVLTVFASQLRWTSSAGDNKGFLGGEEQFQVVEFTMEERSSIILLDVQAWRRCSITLLIPFGQFQSIAERNTWRAEELRHLTTTQQHNNTTTGLVMTSETCEKEKSGEILQTFVSATFPCPLTHTRMCYFGWVSA